MKRRMMTAIFAAMVFSSFSFSASAGEHDEARETEIREKAPCLKKLPLDRRHKSCRGRSGRWW